MSSGTLDVLGLAVYRRADGSIYFNKEGARRPVHGNTLWTTFQRVKMRGDHPLTNPPTSDSARLAASNQEQDELERAIAASIQDLDDNNSRSDANASSGASSCVVCLTASVDHMIRSCNHACVCATCAPRLNACPLCREPVASIERIWLP